MILVWIWGFRSSCLLSRVPTTGVFDKCAYYCALYKEPSEKLAYCSLDWFVRQTVILGYTCQMFAWSLWLRARVLGQGIEATHRKMPVLVHTQVTCLLVRYQRVVGTHRQTLIAIPFEVCRIYWQSVRDGQVASKCTSAPLPLRGKCHARRGNTALRLVHC
jgi:hypothetical protein